MVRTNYKKEINEKKINIKCLKYDKLVEGIYIFAKGSYRNDIVKIVKIGKTWIHKHPYLKVKFIKYCGNYLSLLTPEYCGFTIKLYNCENLTFDVLDI